MALTDTEVAFLRGLIVGEGSFMISLKRSKSCKFNVVSESVFKIKMAEESNILPLLQSKTQLGNVYEQEPRNGWAATESWEISHSDELGRLQTILRRSTADWKEFLRGLIAAEGYFGIRLRNAEGHKFDVESRPGFQIQMAEESNILPLLQSKTGLGYVYKKERKDGWSDTELWEVLDSEELSQLQKMIEENENSLFWETDKGETFDEWERAIELKEEIGTSDPDAVKEIIDIAKGLNSGSGGRPAEEWKQIVDDAVEARSEQ